MEGSAANRGDHLKAKFDELVARDTEVDKGYNYIMHNTLETVLQTMKQNSSDFQELYNGLYYGGSYYFGILTIIN